MYFIQFIRVLNWFFYVFTLLSTFEAQNENEMVTSSNNAKLQVFKNLIGIKFQLYNSLFTALPFHKVEKTFMDTV